MKDTTSNYKSNNKDNVINISDKHDIYLKKTAPQHIPNNDKHQYIPYNLIEFMNNKYKYHFWDNIDDHK